MRSIRVKVGKEAEIELLLGRKKEWLGIGAVTISGEAMRNGEHPMTVRLRRVSRFGVCRSCRPLIAWQ